MKDVRGDVNGAPLYLAASGEGRTGGETLLSRAASLRRQASVIAPVLADTYRRRAAELELQAWVLAVRAGAQLGPIAA